MIHLFSHFSKTLSKLWKWLESICSIRWLLFFNEHCFSCSLSGLCKVYFGFFTKLFHLLFFINTTFLCLYKTRLMNMRLTEKIKACIVYVSCIRFKWNIVLFWKVITCRRSFRLAAYKILHFKFLASRTSLVIVFLSWCFIKKIIRQYIVIL